MTALERSWYSRSWLTITLLPLAWLYALVMRVRRWAYAHGWLRSVTIPVPVIVVGNIVVGGTGKTPLVIWLAQRLHNAGYRPAIVSRGYRGQSGATPRLVHSDDDPAHVGDEPVLLAQHAGCPVVVCTDRPRAALFALQHGPYDVIISDDGLQHYALQRDIEIVVIDGIRRFGNGHSLPAGPLREPVQRLQQADFIVCHGQQPHQGEHSMTLRVDGVALVRDGRSAGRLQELSGQRVHAVAGIGHPQRFFTLLRDHGLELIEHVYPDHYAYAAEDIEFGDELPVLMTEKDAVKCRGFAREKHRYVPVSAQLDEALFPALIAALKGRPGRVK